LKFVILALFLVESPIGNHYGAMNTRLPIVIYKYKQ